MHAQTTLRRWIWRCVLLATAVSGAGALGLRAAPRVAAQDLIWAKPGGGSDGSCCGAVAAHPDGGILGTGWFSGDAYFRPPGQTSQTLLRAAGFDDIFLAKVTSDGQFEWVRQAGGDNPTTLPWEQGSAVTALPDGSPLVSGSFAGQAAFGVGETSPTLITSAGHVDAFLAKYNDRGRLVWVRRAGGTGHDEANGLVGLADGGAIVAGLYENDAVFGSGETSQTLLRAYGSGDVFVARYLADGRLAWARRAGSADGWDNGWSAAPLPDGGAVVAGMFWGSAVFGDGEPSRTLLTSAGNHDIFLARYASDGRLVWARRAGGGGNDLGWAVAVSSGTVLVTGFFRETATFGPGEQGQTVLTCAGDGGHGDLGGDVFLAKYAYDGRLMWARRAGGADIDWGFGLAALPDGGALVTGLFAGTATFGPGEPRQTIVRAEGDGSTYDAYLARYDASGRLVWVRTAGGVGEDSAYAVAVLRDGNYALAGRFENSATFGRGEPTQTTIHGGPVSAFMAKYSQFQVLAARHWQLYESDLPPIE